MAGEPLDLQCSVCSTSDSKLMWQLPDIIKGDYTNTPASNDNFTTNTIRISKMKESYEGLYTCTVTSVGQSSKFITVKGILHPKFSYKLT